MVSTTIPEKSCLPDGRFRLVGWDVDSTGQLVTDEICHLAAYTPKEDFSQYIMPYKDLTKFAQRRYMMYTKTIGRFRALKDRTNNKMIRTKSEISALVDFLMWLERVKNQEPACTGLILLCHDAFELAPLLLIQALKRYDLLDRFSSIVKGFGNCYAFVKFKCESSVTSFSLKTLSKILLDKENEQTYSARNRARIAYQLVQHLRAGMVESAAAVGSGAGDGSTVLSGDLGELSQFTWTVADKESTIPGKLVQLQRQMALLPLFRSNDRQSTRLSMHERRRVTQLRSQLLDTMLDYETLRKTWTEGNKEKLIGLLECALSQSNEEDRQEIVKIAVRHFECPPRVPAKGRRRGSSKSMSENSAPQTPTSSSPSNSSNENITPPTTNGNGQGYVNGISLQSAINSTTSE